MNRRSLLFWLGVVITLAVSAVLVAGTGDEPLDPASTRLAGTHGLVTLLDELGVEVVDALPDDDTTAAMVMVDRLTPDERQGLLDWADAGGVLIVADPSSEIVGAPFSPSFGFPDAGFIRPEVTVDCSFWSTRGVGPRDRLVVAGVADEIPSPLAGMEACTATSFGPAAPSVEDPDFFPPESSGNSSWMWAKPQGDGYVVALASQVPFANEYLAEDDNAVIAVALLVGVGDAADGARPDEGTASSASSASFPTAKVSLLFADQPGANPPETVTDLIPDPVRSIGWQLVIAAALYLWWRGRRFGSPVTEPTPVDLPASLLVRSTAELHRKAGGHRQAYYTLRRQLLDELRADAGLPAHTSDAELREHLTTDGRLSPQQVADVFKTPITVERDELLAMARQHDHIRATARGETAQAEPPNLTPVP